MFPHVVYTSSFAILCQYRLGHKKLSVSTAKVKEKEKKGKKIRYNAGY